VEISLGKKLNIVLFYAIALFLYWLIFLSHSTRDLIVIILMHLLYSRIGFEIGIHRYFCHRSFKAHVWAEYLFLFLSVANGAGSPLVRTAVHRLHHAKEDQPEDPHSPANIGSLRVMLHMFGDDWHKHCAPAKDLIRDPRQRFVHKFYFELLAVFVIALSLAGFHWFVILWAAPVTITMLIDGALNVIGHKYGYKNYETLGDSRNNFWLNLVMLGSGMHNNHHGNPASPTLNTLNRWSEFDLWGQVIKVFRRA